LLLYPQRDHFSGKDSIPRMTKHLVGELSIEIRWDN